MAKGMGNWSGRTIQNLQLDIGEALVGQLIDTEILFYVLTDTVGMNNDDAKFWALKVYGGGRTFDANEVSKITSDKYTAYQLNTRQATRFIHKHMKSSRISIISDRPYVWEMNGFGTNEKPYIAGAVRGCKMGAVA